MCAVSTGSRSNECVTVKQRDLDICVCHIVVCHIVSDNGYVEYDEFLLLMKRWASTASKAGSFGAGVVQDDEAREVFGIFDVDGNGFIDRHELRFIMSRLGENPGERDICEMFRLADLNGDGLIDYDGA